MEKMAHIFPLKTPRKGWLKHGFFLLTRPTSMVLGLILIVASFMRLYRIADYMTFLGDEGRDAIVAKEILEGNLTLLGPRASAGDFFLGPIYYYMIAPFLWIFNYDPVGPAIMVALFGIATVFLVYFISARLFNKPAGLIAAGLYALSPLVIAFSRSSWNPNPVPFFALLMFYLGYEGVRRKSIKIIFIVGILFGITLQLHYIATFIGILLGAFILIGSAIVDRRNLLKRYLMQLGSLGIGFTVSFSPFLAFEIRHGFPNIKTILEFVFVNNFTEERVQYRSHLEIVQDVFFRLYARLLLHFPPPEQVSISEHWDLQVLQIAAIILIVSSVIALFFVKNKLVMLLFTIWLLGGVFLFGFYKRTIYDYYYAFMFPVPFILVGNLLGLFTRFKGMVRYILLVIALIILGGLIFRLISGNPFQFEPNRQKDQAERIAEFVLDQTNDEPYNFALVTLGNSDHVFRYFFEVNNHPPVVIENMQVDPDRSTVTDQLFVICDYDCEPVGNALWEVAGFGPARIENQWNMIVGIYKLVHVEPEVDKVEDN